MKKLIVLLAALAALAAAPAGQRIDGDHVRVSVPAAWKPMPEAAKAMRTGLVGAGAPVTGDAQAYGDTAAGVFALLLWVDSKQAVTTVRPEVEAFMGGLRGSLEASGAKASRWDISETATRYSVRFGLSRPGVEAVGRATSLVDKKGILHGYAVACIRTGDAQSKPKASEQASAACEAALSSFELSWKDAELKKLEKK